MAGRFTSFLATALVILASMSALADPSEKLSGDVLASGGWSSVSFYLVALDCKITSVDVTSKDAIRVSFAGNWTERGYSTEFSVGRGLDINTEWLGFVRNFQGFTGRHATIIIDTRGTLYSRGDNIQNLFPMDRVTITEPGSAHLARRATKTTVAISPLYNFPWQSPAVIFDDGVTGWAHAMTPLYEMPVLHGDIGLAFRSQAGHVSPIRAGSAPR